MTEGANIVYIVEDDRPMRESLSLLIQAAGIEVRSFDSAEAFLEAGPPAAGGCLVLDVRLGDMGGLELQEVLRQRGVMLPVIIVTGHGDIPMTVRAMRAGAVDVIEKPYDPHQLLARIQQVLDGTAGAPGSPSTSPGIQRRFDRLTPREREVMEMLVAGQTVKEIALKLGLSHKTVQVHRARILEKTDTDSVVKLIWLALDKRIL